MLSPGKESCFEIDIKYFLLLKRTLDMEKLTQFFLHSKECLRIMPEKD